MSCFIRSKRSIATVQQSVRNMSSEATKICLVVIGYWFISISLVFANKFLLGNKDSGHDVSLFVAWVQCIVTVLFIVSGKFIKAFVKRSTSVFKLKLKETLNVKLLMLTCTYVGMLTFNNLCLRNVGVAFYQVARSLTLLFVVILSLLILKKSVSWRIWLCCMTVAGGFVLGVDQENLAGTLSISGVAFGVITSLFVSLNGILTKQALDIVDRDSVQLTLLNNLNAILLFAPFVIGTGQLHTVIYVKQFHSAMFWGFLCLTGILGCAIAWISAVQIDLTSPVTHHISANSKAVLQTVIAVMWSHDVKPLLWWSSVLLVIGGALSYAVIRVSEDSHEKATKDRMDHEHREQLIPNGISNGVVKPI